MKLQLNQEFNLFEHNGNIFCDSLQIAETFGKRHKHVLNTIEGVNKEDIHISGLIDNILRLDENPSDYFIKDKYKDSQNKTQPLYLLTKKGFTLLAMGFTSHKAIKFKIAYINRFEQMENFIKTRYEAKRDFPELTVAINFHYSEPKSYRYSNEMNMINKIVLGMTAKEFKRIKGIDSDITSIRDYLSQEQIKDIQLLQKSDIGLLYSGIPYESRKEVLTKIYRHSKRLIA